MIAKVMKTFSFGMAALAATTIVAAAEGDPTGVWLDAAGRGAVEIAPCGTGSELCGRVVWVKSANHQKRCGEQILGSLNKGSNGTWGDGWIYSPDRGRKFDVEIKQTSADQLRVVGWAGIRMFSETHLWTRAAPDLARCGGEQTAAAKSKPEAIAGVPVPAAPSATAAPAPAPAASSGRNDKLAAADVGNAAEDSKAGEKRGGSGGGSGVRPAIDKYFKRSADGTCKVDTPWIKVKFDCKNH